MLTNILYCGIATTLRVGEGHSKRTLAEALREMKHRINIFLY